MSTTADSKYEPYASPQEAAAALGVPLSQRLKPDFSKAVPARLVSKAEALARGWPWYFTGSDVCRLGHNSARRTSNENICAECQRLAAGETLPLYGVSRTQKYYKQRDPAAAAVTANGAPATAAPPAPPAQVEPTKKEVELLSALAEHGGIDKACEAVGWVRPQMEARYSVNEVFRKAVDATLERLQIPRTLKSTKEFTWTKAVQRDLVNHFVNSGLMHSAREAVGCSASEYFAHLESSAEFRSIIETARPMALETLKEKSLFAASTGNDRLLKILTDGAEAPDEISTWSHERCNMEIEKLLLRFQKQGVLVEPTTDSNADLVSA